MYMYTSGRQIDTTTAAPASFAVYMTISQGMETRAHTHVHTRIQVEAEQRRRHEFTLRRRKLLTDDAADANGWDIGGKEKNAVLECEARIEQMCMDALGLQQKATKMKQACFYCDIWSVFECVCVSEKQEKSRCAWMPRA